MSATVVELAATSRKRIEFRVRNDMRASITGFASVAMVAAVKLQVCGSVVTEKGTFAAASMPWQFVLALCFIDFVPHMAPEQAGPQTEPASSAIASKQAAAALRR